MGSCLPWGSLSLILLVLLQHMLHSSSGCFVEERAALLDIRSSLVRAHSLGALDSWRQDDDGCCSWERVKCNNSTQRVSHLNLSSVYVTNSEESWYLNSTMFSALHELEYLDMSNNRLALEELVGLAKLRYLDLSTTTLGGGFPEFLGRIVSLEVLVLNYNNLDGSLPAAAVENLTNLRQLNMSSNYFDGNLPASLFALPRLKILDLSRNKFGGKFPINSSSGPISLEVLDLRGNILEGTFPVTAFRNITNLNLGINEFSGSLPVSIFSLPHLKFLDLSNNKFEGQFPVAFSSEPVPLEVLYLDHNKLSGTLPNEQAFEILKNLRELSLSYNQFSGNIPTSLFSLPHMEWLDLSTNFFTGPIPINPSSNLSSSLKSLRFSTNNLGGRFSFIWLGNLTKLEEIDLSGNADLFVDVNISGWSPPFQLKQLLLSGCDLDKNIIAEPHFLRTQHHLEVLDLSSNNLSGSMPNWLFTEEATLQDLNLRNNSLTGSLDSIWYTQSSLMAINIHMNHVAGQLPANISSMFPNLFDLVISGNNFFGHIPTSLCEISNMETLDLSNNKLSGEVPACMFTNYSWLLTLKVSNNKLGGLVFAGVNILPYNMEELYLDNNKFEGKIPPNISGEYLNVMDLHDNKLSGELDIPFWNLPSLVILNLSGNRMTSKIGSQICGFTKIALLDLSSNKLTGYLPNCSFVWLSFLNLSGNSLMGDISYLFNASELIALDIRNNQFTGNLHWVQYLDNIIILSLGRNKFEGQITPNLCKLMYLRIIDLSHNKLSGSLPACVGNISFNSDTDDQLVLPAYWASNSYNSFYGLRGFNFATKGNLYTYGRGFFVLMSGIDLSANMLDGEIPWELGNLSHIKSLNLSNNFFVGRIPATFGAMAEIESLDLSHNELSGPIPWQLTQLSSLGAFSVAYNNLSGCIPNHGQLGSFSMDSYQANTNLHAITQGNTCAAPGPDPAAGKDVEEMHSDQVLCVVTVAGFVLAFWATIGFSFCHPYGRSVMLKM